MKKKPGQLASIVAVLLLAAQLGACAPRDEGAVGGDTGAMPPAADHQQQPVDGVFAPAPTEGTGTIPQTTETGQSPPITRDPGARHQTQTGIEPGRTQTPPP
jgi:hypothetical protein